MNPTDSTELRTAIVEILGLEVSPDGEPDQLLSRDENDNVIEGSDWSEEVDQLLALFSKTLEAKTKEAQDDYIEVTLGWMSANRRNLSVNEIIYTLEAQLKLKALKPPTGEK